jgi:hypothetical protein
MMSAGNFSLANSTMASTSKPRTKVLCMCSHYRTRASLPRTFAQACKKLWILVGSSSLASNVQIKDADDWLKDTRTIRQTHYFDHILSIPKAFSIRHLIVERYRGSNL